MTQRDFYKDQQQNVASDSGSRYSVITYRVALAVFSRRPAAYEALKSFNILQLPSVSTMKTYMRANREVGPVYHSLQKRKRRYEDITNFKMKLNLPVPLGEGALIFDEVKVSASIYWNAKSNKIVCQALSPEDISSLHDIYQEISPSGKMKRHHIFFNFYSET